uniref:FBD domain-containing protein n=1 Tax=Arundo donax TaxID=35708 RepID=A0A0A9G924_ARUDO
MHAILSTFSLLRSAPNLKELEIEINDGEQEIEANAEFQNTLWTDGLCLGLQIVKMNGIRFWSNEMCFIELLLSKATVLRTMSITLGYGCSKSKENALSELNTFRRASPHARVFFKGITE